MIAKAEYKPTKWDEKPYETISSDAKLAKTSATFAFTGQLEGNASVEYLMFYEKFDASAPHASSATYVGLIRFDGRLDGKQGSFVMEDNGSFKAGSAESTLKIIPNSGVGDLNPENAVEADFSLEIVL